MALIFSAATPVLAVPPLPEIPAQPPADVRIFQDWTVACESICGAGTVLRGAPPDAPEIARLTVRRLDKEISELVIATPLPLYLPDPLILIPEAGAPVPTPWYTCGAPGCEVRILLSPDLLRLLKRGKTATIEMSLLDRTRVRLPISLLGFTAAYRDLPVSLAP